MIKDNRSEAGCAMRSGVLITVGLGVAVLMALWPLMVAVADFAVIGLGAVAALALGVLVVDARNASARRQD